MLSIENLSAGYYGSNVLQNVQIKCEEEITLVIGPNGAGKSTIVKSITGSLRPISGKIIFENSEIQNRQPYEISRLGISTVPERGRIFREMSVEDNLRLAFETSGSSEKGNFEEGLDIVLDIFPDLKERLKSLGGTMSGGQQQMVSIARALITKPKFLIMDEPTTGLYPKLLGQLLLKIKTISSHLPILLTEQNVSETVPIAKKVYLLEAGRIVAKGSSEEMMKNEIVKKSYLGQNVEGSGRDGHS